jgi:hypothetical protein
MVSGLGLSLSIFLYTKTRIRLISSTRCIQTIPYLSIRFIKLRNGKCLPRKRLQSGHRDPLSLANRNS